MAKLGSWLAGGMAKQVSSLAGRGHKLAGRQAGGVLGAGLESAAADGVGRHRWQELTGGSR